MPVHGSLLTAGAGSSIPISAGGGTSGDAFSESGAINIGGLFGGGIRSARSDNMLPVIIIVGLALVAGLFFLRR